MWKLLLSQSTEGFWEASSTTAFALEARDPLETANLQPTLVEWLKQALSNATDEVRDDHGDVIEAAVQAMRGGHFLVGRAYICTTARHLGIRAHHARPMCTSACMHHHCMSIWRVFACNPHLQRKMHELFAC